MLALNVLMTDVGVQLRGIIGLALQKLANNVHLVGW